MSKTKKEPVKVAAKAAKKVAAPKAAKKVAAPKLNVVEKKVGDNVNYVMTKQEADMHNRPYPCTITMQVMGIGESGEHLLKGEARMGDSWQTGAFYSEHKQDGTFY